MKCAIVLSYHYWTWIDFPLPMGIAPVPSLSKGSLPSGKKVNMREFLASKSRSFFALKMEWAFIAPGLF